VDNGYEEKAANYCIYHLVILNIFRLQNCSLPVQIVTKDLPINLMISISYHSRQL